ncbi:ATP-dependent metallopeptidase FtsH/Yme1/Tma family protein [Lachnoanaerobaculum gingivalis]|jgi:ATP-dependent metallopeptidase hflB|uniref:ATP-dependent zinc metalloprotease FtsH n=1 Tax=Lachnoanaerobaculum gingivalis TaxID=2490855 RepID=A0A3P3QU35_9FIRM|nr:MULTISPECIES: ATP-dependent zinc metalloprotease FtsH [Lachnoanaerobaculum]ETO98464.1 ATP-dependent metallopeptidase HflB [Lachnoanaerobaculum sp. MSX33]RRJ24248.1 ATP-dependent metallopeptidase FtsH/Yme1/Tma family protein [Lachnoanaerobaculum gingivalis]WHE87462.1 ATP-dependent zinc metalloprotease FtsH [Lachnoanaerobaculum gingivalis]
MKKTDNPVRMFFLLFVVALIVWLIFNMGNQLSITKLNSAEFNSVIEENNIGLIEIRQNSQTPTGEAIIYFKNQEKYGKSEVHYFISDVNEFIKKMESKNITYILDDVPRESVFTNTILPVLLAVAMVMFFVMYMNGKIAAGGGGGNNKMMNFGKSRARIVKTANINFSKVAGLEEEKEELAEVVDFLKDPGKYTRLGARIPKGIILVGPPGTGKTLLAKAVAGEAGVPFFTISGSDFVEMFVGVGASRVRDLFEDAKKNAPCIIFIDEIDAVGRRRGSGLGGSHDEREQTLNQLLVEMDGFGGNQGIIVMAATNRVDILDPALLRPGRFDRKVAVGRPDVAAREAILKIHASSKPLGDDVDLHSVARQTSGFTGADLENLMNESAILSAREGKAYICADDINRAFIKVGIGTEKKSRVVSEKEKAITAYHEAGHAILFRELEGVGPVHTISIIPTGVSAAGYTMPLPGEDQMFNTKSKMLKDIMVSLGGRIAEEIIFGDITTGASSDIKQATKVAKAMVMEFGMNERAGLVNYGNEGDEIFIGRDFGQTKGYSEETASMIDEEVRNIINDCYKKAKEIILNRKYVLESCAKLLIEKEKIGFEEFEALF